MSKRRLNKRIDITIPPDLLGRVDRSVAHYSSSRSDIILWALHEWLERHPFKAEQIKNEENTVTKKSFHELIRPGMRPDELLDTLKDYEADQSNQV